MSEDKPTDAARETAPDAGRPAPAERPSTQAAPVPGEPTEGAETGASAAEAGKREDPLPEENGDPSEVGATGRPDGPPEVSEGTPATEEVSAKPSAADDDGAVAASASSAPPETDGPPRHEEREVPASDEAAMAHAAAQSDASALSDETDPAVFALRLMGITRTFAQGEGELRVLRGVDAEIRYGEVVALVGPSGSGKSTLLHLAGLLERPDQGEMWVAGREAGRVSERERTAIRRDDIGFVYQFHQLLPEFTALENVVLPQMIAGRKRRDAAEEAHRLLTTLGLGERVEHRPSQLSGGEQQRVAIARALANRPRLLLADEPTGNLDPKTAKAVFDRFLETVREEGCAAIIATHNLDLAQRMDRVLLLHDGRLYDGRELAARA